MANKTWKVTVKLPDGAPQELHFTGDYPDEDAAKAHAVKQSPQAEYVGAVIVADHEPAPAPDTTEHPKRRSSKHDT